MWTNQTWCSPSKSLFNFLQVGKNKNKRHVTTDLDAIQVSEKPNSLYCVKVNSYSIYSIKIKGRGVYFKITFLKSVTTNTINHFFILCKTELCLVNVKLTKSWTPEIFMECYCKLHRVFSYNLVINTAFFCLGAAFVRVNTVCDILRDEICLCCAL